MQTFMFAYPLCLLCTMIKEAIFYFGSVFLLAFAACTPSSDIIKDIRIGLHNNNKLLIQIDVATTKSAQVFGECRADGMEQEKIVSDTSAESVNQQIVFSNILPNTKYSFRLYTIENGKKKESKVYHFQSEPLPSWLQEQFKATVPAPQYLPKKFTQGFLVMNKRESPGFTYIVDTKGRLRWYNMADNTGIKVTHFTKDNTILSILGTNDDPTSYGREILEVNLKGDTLVHLKKGEGDLQYTIHHEIIKDNNNNLVTLYLDKRVMNLTSVSGGAKDTVVGDGILVLNKQGKKVWQWSVFDVVDPLKDTGIIRTKKDWMHANSVSFDTDGNYLVSFYNNGQIWKINKSDGKVMWKFGKDGTFAMPADCRFSMAHAAHINADGDLMFFNNGIDKHQSEVYAVKLNEAAQTAKTNIHIKLPQDVYNDRMGSAYLINDTTVLVCCSKRHISILTNKKGVLLWSLDTAIPPYRVEFVEGERLKRWLLP